ncbi:hypothetical protein M440DRAFT_297132 [Trichoderma longibrachiatum ATCC 18648]|uniref:Secreted protein n=1 Tax=Trichoderma longibrachiatum ATCC 18648 TaxID=983965 RepID=A0A2T4C8T0_TRILO|nr:hypothetical protein M440DRAFT_297132 [Trichoderma longibrachiatum ATCC 18648]
MWGWMLILWMRSARSRCLELSTHSHGSRLVYIFSTPSLPQIEVPLFNGAITASTPLYAAPSRSPLIRRPLNTSSGNKSPFSTQLLRCCFYCSTPSIDSRCHSEQDTFALQRDEKRRREDVEEERGGLVWNDEEKRRLRVRKQR